MPITVASPIDQARLAPALRALVRGALDQQTCRTGEIGIALSDDATLRELNRRYRKIPRATDVLSFEYGHGPAAPNDPPHGRRAKRKRVANGDLIISLDRVIAQARRYRVSRGRELARLVIHGALHLAGLDHQTAAERRHMRACEDQQLKQSGAQVRVLERVLDRQAFVAAWREAWLG